VKKVRRTWKQKLMLTFSFVLAVTCGAAGTALLLLQEEVGGIQRISIQGVGSLTKVEQPKVDPVNILVIGVDNAEGVDPGDPVVAGRDTSSMLTDTIMVVRLDPVAQTVKVLSIPRDLWVDLGGSGRYGKINSAVPLGGPETLITTIQNTLGIPINHYVQVNFAGFQNAVNALGGVPLVFDVPTRDRNSGLAIEQPGCWTLDGRSALGFVRSRYYEAQVDGVWISDPLSDRGRVERQQLFIKALFIRGIRQGARNPFEFQRLFNSVKKEIVLDDTLNIEYLLTAGNQMLDIGIEALQLYTLPTEDGWYGEAAVVYLIQPDATQTVNEFLASAPSQEPEPKSPAMTPDEQNVIPDAPKAENIRNYFAPKIPLNEECQSL
jgi:polyisoprenyl-teichoic acid--peptidoglycan teichoic acid transferase